MENVVEFLAQAFVGVLVLGLICFVLLTRWRPAFQAQLDRRDRMMQRHGLTRITPADRLWSVRGLLSRAHVLRYAGTVAGRSLRATFIDDGGLWAWYPAKRELKLLWRTWNRGAWCGTTMRYECLTRVNDLALHVVDRPVAEKPEGESLVGLRTRYRFVLEQYSVPNLSVEPELDSAFVMRASDGDRARRLLKHPQIRDALLQLRWLELAVDASVIRLNDLASPLFGAIDTQNPPPSEQRVDAFLALLSNLAAHVEAAP